MKSYVLITGGAGFVGTNLAHHFLSRGERVMIYDSLARPGVERNLAWLQKQHGSRVLAVQADIRDADRLDAAVARAAAIFHFAAQVAVTTSVLDPAHDFEVNARGALNLLESIRRHGRDTPLIFTSTNKVYGELGNLKLQKRDNRYRPLDAALGSHGFDESQRLDFHSPYGCSKGTADQYVLDYARIYRLPTLVFRMSCIYGPHQFGTEDQGWVAHFLITALRNQPITIYGDGKQVRDILFIDDLVRAFALARARIHTLAGQAFNIGGGPQNAVSLLDVLAYIEELHGQRLDLRFKEWRPGDQRYYVSDTRKFESATGWHPQVDAKAGIRALYHWLAANVTQPVATPLPAAVAPADPTVGAAERLPHRTNGSGKGRGSAARVNGTQAAPSVQPIAPVNSRQAI